MAKSTKKTGTYLIASATNVKLRGRYNGTGEYVSLYLDWQSDQLGSNNRRKREYTFLKDKIYASPKNADQKRHNNIIEQKAKIELNNKSLLLLNDPLTTVAIKSNVNFITFFNECKNNETTDGDKKEYATKRIYDSCLNKFREFEPNIDNWSIKDITPEWLWKLRTFLLADKVPNGKGSQKKGIKKGSARVYWSKLNCTLNLAVKKDFIATNPMLKIDGISKPETEITFLTMDELRQLKKTECTATDLYRAGLFSSRTGLRAGDCKKLKWGDIQYSNKENKYFVPLTQQKTQYGYTIYFKQQIMDILGKPGKPEELVFPAFKNDNHSNYALKIWLVTAGIKKKFTFHDFRHTYAILLGVKGSDLYTISKLLGHKNIQVTEQSYARVLEQTKMLSIDTLEDF